MSDQVSKATEIKTLAELAKTVQLLAEREPLTTEDKRDEWKRKAKRWSITLAYQGRQYDLPFFQGAGIKTDPGSSSVLECILSDASAGEETFDNFCSEFGYDTDSRKAYATWQACQGINKNMRRLLGSDYETFQASER